MRPVSSWGRLEAPPHDIVELTDRDTVAASLARGPGIAYGMGRSYGDACLNPGGVLWRTAGLDRLISFDARPAVLVCEAGVVLRDIQKLMIPRGWSLPVVPGTQIVTVGGAIANDVHGKNHHVVGSFGEHVRRLRLVRSDGEAIDCGPDLRPDLFAATVAGLGLTGLIVEVELQLRPSTGPWLEAETVSFGGLADFFACPDESARRAGSTPYRGSTAPRAATCAACSCAPGRPRDAPASRGASARGGCRSRRRCRWSTGCR